MDTESTLDELRPEIEQLTSAFDQLIAQVSVSVANLGEAARSSALEDLEQAQQGVLAQSAQEIERLKFIINEYKSLESNVAILEQLKGITTHLKEVVAGLNGVAALVSVLYHSMVLALSASQEVPEPDRTALFGNMNPDSLMLGIHRILNALGFLLHHQHTEPLMSPAKPYDSFSIIMQETDGACSIECDPYCPLYKQEM